MIRNLCALALVILPAAASLPAQEQPSGGKEADTLPVILHKFVEKDLEHVRPVPDALPDLGKLLGEAGYTTRRGPGAGEPDWLAGILDNGDGPEVLLLLALPAAQVDPDQEPPSGYTERRLDAAITTGAARALGFLKDHWSGTVRVAVARGSPGNAARTLLEAGALSEARPACLLAARTDRRIPVGRAGARPGPALAGRHPLELALEVPSDSRGLGPLELAAEMVLAFADLPRKELGPMEPARVEVETITSGGAGETGRHVLRLQVVVRALRPASEKRLVAAMKRVARHRARAAGLSGEVAPEISVQSGSLPPVVNAARLAGALGPALVRFLGVPFRHLADPQPELTPGGLGLLARNWPEADACLLRVGAHPPPDSGERLAAAPVAATGARALAGAVLHILGPR